MYSHLTIDELRNLAQTGDTEVLTELGRRVSTDFDSVVESLIDDAIADSVDTYLCPACGDEYEDGIELDGEAYEQTMAR